MQKNLTHLKQKLEEERILVISELKNVGIVKNEKSPDDWQAVPADMEIQRPDANEVADRIESYEGNTAIVQELEKRLNEIDRALTLMKENKFGLCEKCGKEIESDRLEANPAAKTCKEHMN
jgi:DnaK suppressor protein